ncbi:MAG: RHS repeat-associated core domain-containing protein, partial [Xanthomonadaceae bacterium]|nr:RHS repeat-associated core domain-containing protein [Xanthomonadaceae bacterium]
WQSSTGRREATGSVTGVGHRFDGALQRGIDYRYDVYGNLTEQALDAGAVIESLHYDPLHRLTQTSRSGAASGTVSYGYDAAGNFQYKSDFSSAATNAYSYSGGACGGGPNAVKSVQLKAGGSRSYCYDGAGNLISDSTGMSLRYDASQRPTAMHRGVADSQFRYGPDGDKARQWGSSGQRIYVAGVEDRPDTNETERYLGDYGLIKQSASGRKVQYLLRDRLGSVIGIADDAGTVEWRGFDAFGAPRSGDWADKSPNILGPSTATAHGFTQHEHLDGLGLIHMNGRVYDYALGRFLGVDPFIQFPGNSQSLNPYSYIMNNPLAGTDPTGYQIADPRTLCARDPSACNSTNSSSDLSAFTNAGGGGPGTRGGQRANGAAAGQRSAGAQGSSGGDASELGAKAKQFAGDLGQKVEPFLPATGEFLQRGEIGTFRSNAEGVLLTALNAFANFGNRQTAILREIGFPLAEIPTTELADDQLAGRAVLEVGVLALTRGRSARAEVAAVGERATTVFRVEGAANQRLFIGAAGDVRVAGDNMLFLNFGDAARAESFLATRLGQGFSDSAMKSFQVPSSFVDFLARSAVPENLARQFPNSPLAVDATKATNQFGLRPAQIEELRKVIIQGSGR